MAGHANGIEPHPGPIAIGRRLAALHFIEHEVQVGHALDQLRRAGRRTQADQALRPDGGIAARVL